ncbi:hypothetical protein TIFTF001_027810 [Ficus carica]|uniref:Uncharacterized protein n=1 Tax=Ficus carica TaxID=3494 RepID=A0AA88DNW3_FICCA|nr:hypothetical protein TIFTF001_027810 [Ficus carica]
MITTYVAGSLQSWYQSDILPAYFTLLRIVSANAQNRGPPDAGVLPAPVNQSATPKIPNANSVIPENPIAPKVPVEVEPLAVPPTPLV